MKNPIIKNCWVVFISLNLIAQQNFFTTNQNASLMLSGAGFNNTGGTLQFNHPSGIATDGTRFLLCDRFNNRVLIWKTIPTKWDAPPDIVLGQDSMTHNLSDSSLSGLNFPGNVSVSKNGIVAVADTYNDRILIWKTFPEKNKQKADVIISLPKLTPQGSQMRYGWPWGVWTDGTKLAAVATHGSTILFWNSIPTINDQQPDYKITHPHFGTPRNISTDGSTFLFVGDHNQKVGGDKAGTFFWNTYPTTENQAYDFFRDDVGWIKGTKLSDGRLAAGGLSFLYIWDSIPRSANIPPKLTINNAYYNNGDGVDVVEAGGKLFVNNYNGNNVQVYDPIPSTTTVHPSFVIGSPIVSTNTLEKINYIQNPNVATDGKILIATSDFDRTLWLWKTLPTKSGQAPDVKISLRGDGDISAWDNAMWNNNIVLAGKQKVAVWNKIPVNGEKHDYILSNKIGDVTFNDLSGIALDSLYFYLADRSGKISIWKGIPKTGTENSFLTIQLQTGLVPNQIHSDGEYFTITANPPKIYIYKVSEFVQNATPQPFKTLPITQNLSLNLPSVTITYKGAVAIANNSNNNVILWKNISDAGDASKAIILGQPSLNNFIPGNGANQLFFPSTLAMFENELWVGEFKFSSRILKFEYPKNISQINWKQYFTLNENEGKVFEIDTNGIFEGGVPVINIASGEKIILSNNGNQNSFEVIGSGASYTPIITSKQRPADGGAIYLPDGKIRFLGEVMLSVNPRKSRIESSISYDGINWTREDGIRYQPGVEDDSISSVPSFHQVKDSIWRMYYVGDFSRTNGTRTAISTDWGKTWQAESKKNILKYRGDVDPHPVYLSNGKTRLYFRTGMNDPNSFQGIAYCESNDGLNFDTTKIISILADSSSPKSLKLDPWVIKFKDGTVGMYIGALPMPNIPWFNKAKMVFAKSKTINIVTENILPKSFNLFQNYPNPFNSSTIIKFEIPQKSFVNLTVYDILGREIKRIVNSEFQAGSYSVTFNAEDLQTGIYFYTLKSLNYTEIKKAILLK